MEQQKLTGNPSIDKPWLKYYPQNANITTKGSLFDYLKFRNQNNMNSTAILYFGKEISYKKFLLLIEQLATTFVENGVKPGDKVVILGLNTPEIIGSIYALNKIGAICCIESVIQLEKNLMEIIYEYNAKYIVVLDAVFDKYKSIFTSNVIEKVFLTRLSDSMTNYMKVIYNLKEKKNKKQGCIVPLWKSKKIITSNGFEWNDKDTAVLLSTSGSTGVPKRVELSNSSINALAIQSSYVDLDLKPGKSMLSSAPPFLAYGISLTIHMPLCNGMTVILSPNPDPDFVAKQFIKYKPNTFIGSRVFLDKIMKFDKDMSYVSAIEIGGEAVAVEYIEKVEKYLRMHKSDAKVLTGYGMTELSGSSTTESRSAYRKESVGIPNYGVNMKVIDIESGTELSYGEEGELYINSPCLMNSYYKNEEETDNVISLDEQGNRWIKTGDLARIDEDGFIYIVGRIKRIAVTVDPKDNTHIKIYLDYIEQMINSISFVARSAVIAVEDEERMAIPIAFVSLSNDYENAEEKIIEELKIKTEPYNIPAECFIVDEIPVLSNGKIDFKQLEDKYRIKKYGDYKLDDNQEKMFQKYAITYSYNKDKQCNIENQKYVYGVMKKKGINETSVEKLIDMLQNEICRQYEMKNHIENKAGFLLALWGILLGVFLQMGLYTNIYKLKLFQWCLFASVICMGILSLYFIIKTLTIREYSRYKFSDRTTNYRCAVEDKELFIVRILESYTNCCEKNEIANKDKAIFLSKAMLCTSIYILTIIINTIIKNW